jgi:hypothetical protein
LAVRLLLLLLLSGCATTSDPGFRVTWSRPDDGDAVRPDARLALAFSEPTDPDSCDAETVLLRTIDAESRAVLEIPVTLSPIDQDGFPYGFEIGHEPLVPGAAHALVVLGGDDGCLSLVGRSIDPFLLAFDATAPDE